MLTLVQDKTEGMMAQLGPWEGERPQWLTRLFCSISSLGVFHNPVSDFSPESFLVTPEMICSLNVERVFKVEQVREERGEAPKHISQSPGKYVSNFEMHLRKYLVGAQPRPSTECGRRRERHISPSSEIFGCHNLICGVKIIFINGSKTYTLWGRWPRVEECCTQQEPRK